jgi:hypothetical protein
MRIQRRPRRRVAGAIVQPEAGFGPMPRRQNATGDAVRTVLRSLVGRLRDERQAPLAAKALEDAECRLFLQEYEAFHTELRERDPEAWAELERERREFDGTLLDGLEDE